MTESTKKPAIKAAKKPAKEIEQGAKETVRGLLDEVEKLAHQFEHWVSVERSHWAKSQIIDRLNKIRGAL